MNVKKNNQINLLPQLKFITTPTGRILTWVLSTFRILVIFTEILVMGAFLYRFWLDVQNGDLNDAIEEKKARILSYADFETKFIDVQERLKIYSNVVGSQVNYADTLKDLTVFLPPDVTLKSISSSETRVNVEGNTPSERSIQQYITNLQTSGNLQNVTLTDVTSNINNQQVLTFKISAELKKPKT